MDDKALYARILGLMEPWTVEKVELQLEQGEIHVWTVLPAGTLWVCPECLERAPIHDHKERIWRHLDTCQYKTLLHARVPRLDCPNHGIRQIRVPWAEDRSRFTALFEALAIDWMKQAPIRAVAQRLRLSWDEAAHIQERAVERGLVRRQPELIELLGVDETSFQRGHEYVTVVGDLARSRVLYVADDRKTESLDGFWASLTPEQVGAVKAVAMDMWDPYINSTSDHLADPTQKIVFDKYHVAGVLSRAVDLVRREENRFLRRQGNDALVGSKYQWLRNPETFSEKAWDEFARLRNSKLKTARAWALKETFMEIYDCTTPEEADDYFRRWFGWARRSKLDPVKKAALTLYDHWTNIRTWFIHRISNAASEGLNAGIQRIKYMSRGFRNRQRFRTSILFHFGGLDLYTSPLRVSQ
jgi:transposase